MSYWIQYGIIHQYYYYFLSIGWTTLFVWFPFHTAHFNHKNVECCNVVYNIYCTFVTKCQKHGLMINAGAGPAISHDLEYSRAYRWLKRAVSFATYILIALINSFILATQNPFFASSNIDDKFFLLLVSVKTLPASSHTGYSRWVFSAFLSKSVKCDCHGYTYINW